MKMPPFLRPRLLVPGHAARQQALSATISETLSRAFRDAGLATAGGVPPAVRATIDDALSAAGLHQTGTVPPRGATYDAAATTIDVDDGDAVFVDVRAAVDGPARGRCSDGTFANAAGTRRYKLYVPAPQADATAPRALVMMLHGCTQSPDDFAAGTRMNAVADRENLVVVYPAQDANANGSRCWNWFRPQDQEREHGEPAILAGMACEIARAHGVDRGHVFVAGLSAGAGMAVILGATYPDVFAGVGAHSGLPYRAAHDMPSAFAVMHGRKSMGSSGTRAGSGSAVPTIVFHGDADTTVTPANGESILGSLAAGVADGSVRSERHDGRSADGTPYQRTVYVDLSGRPIGEHWRLAGVGHAWAGGSAAGSYTQPGAPDASSEMVRFFRAVGSGNA